MKKLVVNAGIAAATLLSFAAVAPSASALSAIKGQTFTTSSDPLPFIYHGDNAGVPTIYPELDDDFAEVGRFNLTNQISLRGHSEFDLSSLADLRANDAAAYDNLSLGLSFDLFKQGGARPSNDNPIVLPFNTINIYTYGADGLENANDHNNLPPISSLLTSFQIDDTTADGTSFHFDIKDVVTGLLDDSESHLGVILQTAFPTEFVPCGSQQCSAAVFNDFALKPVPTPAAILPAIMGMMTAASRKKKSEEELA